MGETQHKTGALFALLFYCNFMEIHFAITKLQPFYLDLDNAWITCQPCRQKVNSVFGTMTLSADQWSNVCIITSEDAAVKPIFADLIQKDEKIEQLTAETCTGA